MNQRTIDPITLEIWWSRLVAIADEAATTLVRTAFSTIIRESNDYTQSGSSNRDPQRAQRLLPTSPRQSVRAT
jgi:hypothetical protein